MTVTKIAEKVVALSDAIQSYWDRELPKRLPNYPAMSQSDDVGDPPPQEEQLKDLLTSLSDVDIFKLATVMYLGRGDFSADKHFAKNYDTIRENLSTKEGAIRQIMEKTPLSDYLLEGLDALKKARIDIDAWKPRKRNALRA